MSDFGKQNPRDMPSFLFPEHSGLDYESAIAADIDKQNYGVCPRYWYIDAKFRCTRCEKKFLFSANEQRHWYEELGFWVDAYPKHCLDCRRKLRKAMTLRQEYDREIARALQQRDLAAKKRLAEVIDTLYEFGDGLPERMNENRKTLANQIAKLEDRTQ